MKKKLFTGILAITTIFASASPTFATVGGEDVPQITVIQDDNNVRIVQVVENGVTSEATFYKSSNILSTETGTNNVTFDLDDQTNTDGMTVDTGSGILEANEQPMSTDPGITTYSSISQHTWTNYEYEYNGSTNTWELHRPKNGIWSYYYFTRKQTSSNRDKLYAFQDAVEAVNDAELVYLGYNAGIGIAAATTIITGGTSLAAALAAMGATGAAVLSGSRLQSKCNKAYVLYFDVLNS